MKYLIFAFAILTSNMGTAQHILNIKVTEVPLSHQGEEIFVTGDFNHWNPDDQAMKLTRNKDGTLSIAIKYTHIPNDRIEFKFTRGSWQTLECTPEGRLMAPHLAERNKDTTIYCQIEGWRDEFPASTASKNVHILNDSFYLPQLDKYRRVWIYLPENYQTSDKRYPVLYMQDGQGLFDEATSVGRLGPVEWGVDETINQSKAPCIVVAVDHDPDMDVRRQEYFYHPNRRYPHAEGKAYLEFIIQTLKPYIDQHYRTLSGKENTGILGSSMGGLLSLYAGLNYPEIFGLVGVFSPSIWLDEGHTEEAIRQLKNKNLILQQQYYFYAGANENREKPDHTSVQMSKDVKRIVHLLQNNGKPEEVQLSIHPHGRHGALYWSKAFPDFYHWFIQNCQQP